MCMPATSSSQMMPTSPPSSKPSPADLENNSHDVNCKIYIEIKSSNGKINTMKQMSDLITHEPGILHSPYTSMALTTLTDHSNFDVYIMYE